MVATSARRTCSSAAIAARAEGRLVVAAGDAVETAHHLGDGRELAAAEVDHAADHSLGLGDRTSPSTTSSTKIQSTSRVPLERLGVAPARSARVT